MSLCRSNLPVCRVSLSVSGQPCCTGVTFPCQVNLPSGHSGCLTCGSSRVTCQVSYLGTSNGTSRVGVDRVSRSGRDCGDGPR